MTRLEYVTGALVAALALTAATKSFVGDCRAVADSELAVAESRAHILSIMEDRYGTNWDKVQQTMNAAHGPEWTNQLAPDQWFALHELRHRLAEHHNPPTPPSPH